MLKRLVRNNQFLSLCGKSRNNRSFCKTSELERQLQEKTSELNEVIAQSNKNHRHLSNIWETSSGERYYYTAGICGTSTAFIVALGNSTGLMDTTILVGSAMLGACIGPKVAEMRFITGLRDRPFRTAFAVGITTGITVLLGYYWAKKKYNTKTVVKKEIVLEERTEEQ